MHSRLIRRIPRERSSRSGVILLVVVALLEIFSIVGVSFVYYADAEQTADRYSEESPRDLAFQSLALARLVRSDLVEAIQGEFDFSQSLQELDQFAESARRQKEDICAAAEQEQDPKTREKLKSLCAQLQELCRHTEILRGLLEELDQQQRSGN